jgi:alpha-galactosidase
MKRRSFIAGSAGWAAASALAPLARAAVPEDRVPRSWRLEHGSTLYVVAVRGAAVTADCYRADAAAEMDPAELEPDGAGAPPADATMIAVGEARQPVSWRVGTWHQPDELTLRLLLSAADQPLDAEIVFAIDRESGVLSRHTVIRHNGAGPAVDVAATLSFWCAVHEPIDGERYLAGEWGREAQVRHDVRAARLDLESRAGKTGFDFQPYVALRAGESTYLCEICWSGNWTMRVVPDAAGAVVLGGLNNWEFRERLAPAGRLRLPAVLFGRFDGGLNAATQRLHDYRRAHRPNPDRLIPVQFNSWYPYPGEPSAEAMLGLVPLAKRLGCEAFVVDAGWYSAEGDDVIADWTERTGDWRTSRRRFPNGLREVSAHCREQGLTFGLWFEPEVIGRLSAVRREHPEWLHHIGGEPPAPDQRAVLNLGVPAARQHVFERVTRILSAVGVGWMKWDFNADIGAGGWAPGLPEELTSQDPLVAHYEGLYRLQDAVRRWFPDLVLEMCASGGGRMDCALLSHAHVNWISDWPGAIRKLAIHIGTQLAHPAVVCNDWLVDWPPRAIIGHTRDETENIDERGDLAFRLRIAMLGSFGVSARLDLWPEADFATATRHVALYREELRPIIHHGDQYLLTEPPPLDGNGDWAAIWYAAKDGLSGVLFAFRLAGAAASRAFPLPGLRPDREYRVATYSDTLAPATGAALAAGLTVTIAAPFQSELCLIEAREQQTAG